MVSLLVVDDETIIRRGLLTTLGKQEGLMVVGAAESGTDALRMVEQLQPDLVITDINMPNMDGLQLLEQLRAIDEDLTFIVCGIRSSTIRRRIWKRLRRQDSRMAFLKLCVRDTFRKNIFLAHGRAFTRFANESMRRVFYMMFRQEPVCAIAWIIIEIFQLTRSHMASRWLCCC